MSKRLRDSDYAAACRARLHGNDGRSVPRHPATPVDPCEEPPPPAAHAADIGDKPRSARSLKRPVLICATIAAVLALPLAAALDPPDLPWDRVWSAATGMTSDFDGLALRNEPVTPMASAPRDHSEGIREAASEPDSRAEPPTAFASLEIAVLASAGAAAMPAPEPPVVTVPEIALVLPDPIAAAAPQQARQAEAKGAAPSEPTSALAPADRDLLMRKGDEMLARGDVSGARLVYRRAADSGDARAAAGMARTYDLKVLRMLRVYGIRPDPDQAAFWYARSTALETRASR